MILSIELKPQADERNQDSLTVEVQNTDQLLLNDSIIEYIVQQGETLYSISKRFMVPMEVLLARNNLEFTNIDVSAEEGLRDEMTKKANGRRTIPQIFFNDEHVGGYQELRDLEKSGKLLSSLK